MANSPRRNLARGTGIGAAITVLQFIWNRVADWQTAQGIYEQRGAIVRWLQNPWIGFSLFVALGAAYLWVRAHETLQPADSMGLQQSSHGAASPNLSAGRDIHFHNSNRPAEEHEKSLPRIVLKQPGAIHVEPVPFTVTDQFGRMKSFTAMMHKVRLVNDPLNPTHDSIAHNVVAKVSFFRGDALLRTVDGRWSESEQPGRRIAAHETIVDLLRMDFAIGDERSIDIALKMTEAADAFIFNNDSYLAEGLQRPDFRLPPGEYHVSLRLRGPYVDKTFDWDFFNPGAGKALALSRPPDFGEIATPEHARLPTLSATPADGREAVLMIESDITTRIKGQALLLKVDGSEKERSDPYRLLWRDHAGGYTLEPFQPLQPGKNLVAVLARINPIAPSFIEVLGDGGSGHIQFVKPAGPDGSSAVEISINLFSDPNGQLAFAHHYRLERSPSSQVIRVIPLFQK